MTEQALSSVALSDALVNLRRYAREHPIQDFHLAVLIESLLAALQVYALRETAEITGGDADWAGEALPPARLNS